MKARSTLRVVKLSQSCWTLAGGSPAASHFSCLAKKSNQKKATPPSPNSRKPSLPGERQRTRPAFDVLNWFFVSGTQTPLPLIHPADSVFGGAERGKVKTRVVMTGGLRLLFGTTSRRITPTSCATNAYHPTQKGDLLWISLITFVFCRRVSRAPKT